MQKVTSKYATLFELLTLGLGLFILAIIVYCAIWGIGVPYSKTSIKLVKYDGKNFYKNVGYNIVDYLLHPVEINDIWVKVSDDKIDLTCKLINIPILNLAAICLWKKNNITIFKFKRIFNKTSSTIYGVLYNKNNNIEYKIQK